jgi:hypothetical protein
VVVRVGADVGDFTRMDVVQLTRSWCAALSSGLMKESMDVYRANSCSAIRMDTSQDTRLVCTTTHDAGRGSWATTRELIQVVWRPAAPYGLKCFYTNQLLAHVRPQERASERRGLTTCQKRLALSTATPRTKMPGGLLLVIGLPSERLSSVTPFAAKM